MSLDKALYDPDPVVRDEARSRVIREADADALGELVRLLDARQRRTRRRVARILSEVEPERARPVLLAALLDGSGATPARTRAAVARIAAVLFPRGDAALGQALADADPRVRRAAATATAPPEALEKALLDDEIRVVERAAESLESLHRAVPPALVEAAVARHDPPPPPLLRLLARVLPEAPRLAAAAESGDATALDHLAEPAALTRLLDGVHRVAAAWGLSRLRAVPEPLAVDPDPRVRAALARALPEDHPLLARLAADEDPGVRWLARCAAAGAFRAGRLAARLEPHARSDAPSAKPPYGLRPTDDLPAVERVPAALALCHTRFDVNLGVAVRSAEAAGLREVFMVGRPDLFRSPARGTDLLLPIRYAADGAALVRLAREAGYQIVAVQQTPDSVPYHRASYPPCPLFVMGAEDEGVPAPLRLAADLVVEIPMFGAIDSLNVAAAATTVMFHWRVHRGGNQNSDE